MDSIRPHEIGMAMFGYQQVENALAVVFGVTVAGRRCAGESSICGGSASRPDRGGAKSFVTISDGRLAGISRSFSRSG
jgi:hypothetical protein